MMAFKPIPDGDLIVKYTKLWNVMKINQDRIAEADAACNLIISGRDRYQGLSTLTHVPWAIIGIIGYREYGFKYNPPHAPTLRWDRSLAQGDAFNVPSVHEPKNRGPFNTWEEAGYDALVNCAPYAAKWKDWTPPGSLVILMKYNGEGYDERGVVDPYIFAGTDQYIKGKYDADEHYDPFLVDKELGCAVLLSRMETILNGKSS
jgi:lysozyme family protein